MKRDNKMKLTKNILKKLIREEIQKLNERYSVDSQYLMRSLKDLIKDAKRNKERDLVKFYDGLYSELNKSYPDGDIDRVDMEDIIYSPHMKKLTLKVPDWIVDDLFNI